MAFVENQLCNSVVSQINPIKNPLSRFLNPTRKCYFRSLYVRRLIRHNYDFYTLQNFILFHQEAFDPACRFRTTMNKELKNDFF
jgi:hypothetical protein